MPDTNAQTNSGQPDSGPPVLRKLWEIYERVAELASDSVEKPKEFDEKTILGATDPAQILVFETELETEIIHLLMGLGNEHAMAGATIPLKGDGPKIKTSESEDSKTTTNLLTSLFQVFTHLDFSEEEAINYWNEIIDHEAELNKKLGRRTGLRVAMLDYFTNKNRLFDNPKIIEINLFDDMVRMSFMDELTGIYNRRFFNHAFTKEMNRAKRYNRPFCFIMFDVDNFKSFNDKFGHTEGDEALKLIGATMESCFRIEDSVCRLGGEEFGVLLPEVTKDNAKQAAERFAKFLYNNSERALKQPLQISGGIACYPEDGEDADGLFKYADACLYRAKLAGKNRFEV